MKQEYKDAITAEGGRRFKGWALWARLAAFIAGAFFAYRLRDEEVNELMDEIQSLRVRINDMTYDHTKKVAGLYADMEHLLQSIVKHEQTICDMEEEIMRLKGLL